MYIQIINSVPSYLLSKAGDVLLITPLTDGVPGSVTRATKHPVGNIDISVSHFAAGSAESERAALGIYPVTLADTFDSDQYISTGKTYTFDTPNGIEAHTLAEHPLAMLKRNKISLLKAEFVRRVRIQNPALDSIDDVAWAREQWLSIVPAARNSTSKFQNAIDHYTAGVAAIDAINSYTEGQEQNVINYNVVTEPTWP